MSFVPGYQVAQVRVIFTLPPGANSLFATADHPRPKYFAYVQWFTPFRGPETNANMYDSNARLYKVKRVVRDGDRLASIVPLRSIRRSVYLFPSFGAAVPAEWTSGNVLDSCSTFYVDPFSDRHAYHTIH